jgi:hypothetical protein
MCSRNRGDPGKNAKTPLTCARPPFSPEPS